MSSYRCFFLTVQSPTSKQSATAVAEICGTSITQIEKTYYHNTAKKIVSNALADYTYVDGMMVPK